MKPPQAHFVLLLATAAASSPDWRNIREGWEIPTEVYADQPYIVKTDDGAWLVCVTTGKGREGEPGQHILTMRSTDQGRTWSAPVRVEPPEGPEASYAVMLKVPSGRIYIFYNHNTDNVRQVKADDPPFQGGYWKRVDSLGHFVFKYSDDHGRSWSARRFDIPLRDFEIDRKNPYQGKLKFFWTVGKPFLHEGEAFVPLHKVGGMGEGGFTSSEGVLLASDNLATERDPEKIRWETLPAGDIGLRAPPGGGPVAEEQSFAVLSDGAFFVVYRTIDGHPAVSYSRDRGRSWETPSYMRFADGRLVKHPRAANFVWRCANGKYLYWFHNHGGRFIREHPRRPSIAYRDRNPAWLAAGEEIASPRGKILRWSEPEIVLYDDDPMVGISYPDLIEDRGNFYLTETQKDVARTHLLDRSLLEGLWGQFENRRLTREGLLVELGSRGATVPPRVKAPELPAFLRRSNRPDYGAEDLRAGFTIEAILRLDSPSAGQVVADNRTPEGKGFALVTAAGGKLELILNDGRTESRWTSDAGRLEAGKRHHLAAIVDGGPKVILFVLDGRLCDGGEERQFGWGRYNPNLLSANGAETLRLGQSLKGRIERLRIYSRALRVSEVIGNWRAEFGL